MQAAERAIPEPRTGVDAGLQPAAVTSVPPIQAGRPNGPPLQPAILSEQQIRMATSPVRSAVPFYLAKQTYQRTHPSHTSRQDVVIWLLSCA